MRIIHWLGFPDKETESVLELLKTQGTIKPLPVVFQNGYRRNSLKVEVMCRLSIGTGKEEWGAAPGKEYYRFHIEKIGCMTEIEKKEREYGN